MRTSFPLVLSLGTAGGIVVDKSFLHQQHSSCFPHSSTFHLGSQSLACDPPSAGMGLLRRSHDELVGGISTGYDPPEGLTPSNRVPGSRLPNPSLTKQ